MEDHRVLDNYKGVRMYDIEKTILKKQGGKGRYMQLSVQNSMRNIHFPACN